MEKIYRLTGASRSVRFYAYRTGIGAINLGPDGVKVQINGIVDATLRPGEGTCVTGAIIDVALDQGQSIADVICFPTPLAVYRLPITNPPNPEIRQIRLCDNAGGPEIWRIQNSGPDNLIIKVGGIEVFPDSPGNPGGLPSGGEGVFCGRIIDIQVKPGESATASARFLN